MSRTIPTENPGKDAARYLRHWGNVSLVEASLQARHTGLGHEQRRRKSRAAALSILQGIEYLDTAAAATILTRPLPLFYAAENLVKGIAMILDPTLEPHDFRAHGLRGDKSRRYSIKNLECAVQSPGSDVWSRAFELLNADWIAYGAREDNVGVTQTVGNAYATAPLPPNRTVALGTLLRHLPELAQDVRLAGWGHPFAIHVATFDLVTSTAPPPWMTLTFVMRHGHDSATRAAIVDRESDLFRRYTRHLDALDVIGYTIGRTTDFPRFPVFRCDIFGSLYIDVARGTLVLSEMLIYLMGLFILADVVRYQVDQWSRLLEDHPAEAILIERFLDLSARKLPNLALNELEGELVLFKVGTV